MKDRRKTIDYFGMTHRGLVRDNNEDAFAALPEQGFFILADGMGGHNAGEIASAEAVKQICASMAALPPTLPLALAAKALCQAVDAANRHIWEMSLTCQGYAGMGTTLSCFLLRDNHLFYAHVGDSRLYRIRNKSILQLTRDHSLLSTLQDKGELDENPPGKNVITRALGTEPHILPDRGILSVAEGDIYLLCSDGLSDLVSATHILHILQDTAPLQLATEKLLRAALEKGGLDNVTVLAAVV